jgi:SAM-dependent methyltransferase
MSAAVDFYSNAYGNYDADVYRQIRVETYGEDLGQTSWVATEESHEIPRTLGVRLDSFVLEIGSGSGRYALKIAENLGCSILGLDVNGPGIRTSNQLAADRGISDRVKFEYCDASKKLPFADCSFDAAFSNDVLCHVPGRLFVLREIFRVLRPGSRFLFSDALVIGGMISHQEIADRSSIGFYIFTPPGENERLIEQGGFRLLSATDTTLNAALISGRWRDARQKRRAGLIAIEGQENFEGFQRFLSTVHTLTAEERLRRYLYVAQRPVDRVPSHPERS